LPRRKKAARRAGPEASATPAATGEPAPPRAFALRAAAGLAAIAVVAVGAWLALSHWRGPGNAAIEAAPPAAAMFVGSERCASCHAAESGQWRGSQHAVAMQHATVATVLGDFDDAAFSYGDVTTNFSRRGDRFWIRTDGPDGKPADFEVKYTFGVAPLQQYLVELPGGRLQAVSVAWDSRPREAGGQRWFHLYPDGRIDYRDELHWTRRAQNWNFMCADCHSTDVRKGYDAAADAFATRYSEVSVGCEACHGPGSAHVAWADEKGEDPAKGLTVALDERRGVAWRPDPATGKPRRSVARGSAREIDVCAQCHARRAQIAEDYRAGRPFMDHYLPSLLTPELYHPDGQQRDEVFIWGSWLQSRMHQAGVTCSDCHDPHTQKLRAPGNAVCAQCHAPSTYDVESHHRHPAGSTGAQCAECHMPRTTYMVVDPRRDHSMRVPRPDESVALGVPNACNACHADRDAKWAAAAVRGWLGRDARGSQSFAAAFHGAESGAPRALDELAAIAFDAAQPPIVRASALDRLAREGRPDAAQARRAAGDPDPLLRLAALRVGDTLPPSARVEALSSLLGDERRAVRIEAARVLAGAQGSLPPDLQAAWQRAADEYVATLRYNADRPESNVALGSFLGSLGRLDEALQAFDRARGLDPDFVPAYVNAADALRAQGRDDASAAVLEQGLARAPDSAALHHSLGLARVRLGQSEAAMTALRRAMELEPDSVRYTYVYAVALHSTGRLEDARRLLERSLQRWPADRDLLFALASFQLEAGLTEAARQSVRRLLAAHPADRDANALAAQLGVTGGPGAAER
jgi:tetratricopeptide (TPR) repeat protein